MIKAHDIPIYKIIVSESIEPGSELTIYLDGTLTGSPKDTLIINSLCDLLDAPDIKRICERVERWENNSEMANSKPEVIK